MKLRKIGDEIKIPIGAMVAKHGHAGIDVQVRERQAAVEAEIAKVKDRKTAAAQRKAASEILESAQALAAENLAARVAGFGGLTLVVQHLGYAERERLRLDAQRNLIENERELANLRSEYSAEAWPDLHAGEVETAEATERLIRYQRGAIERSALRLEGADGGNVTDVPAIAGMMLGFGIGDMLIKEIIDANSPSAAQVF